MKPNSYLAHLRSDAERIATAYEHGPFDAPVAACPGWDLGRLLAHVGGVHRWARHAVLHRVPAGRDDIAPAPADHEALVDWFRAGAAALADALEDADPAARTWHPFPAAQENWVWYRRQALETAVHRWDAETAVGTESDLDPELASAGLAELFEMMLPRVLVREGVAPPAESLHVHCTDVDGEWLVWSEDGRYQMVAEHRKGDAALRGPADRLLLVMLHRAPPTTADVVGDADALDAWLALPGL